MTAKIATGFVCQPLADGNVLIAFHDDTGEEINAVVASADALRHLAVVATTLAVLDVGAVAGSDQRGGQLGRI